MKPIVLDQIGTSIGSVEGCKSETSPPTDDGSCFWLRLFFRCAQRAPWVLRIVRLPVVWSVVRRSAKIRHATAANAERIFGRDVIKSDRISFAMQVVGNFYDFVVDVAQSGAMNASQLRSRIEAVEGHEEFLATRRDRKGAIIVTAHMGSFEVGLAALAEFERDIHVVFKRDEFDQFETIRRRLRTMLGVHEAAIDDGLETWMRLRDALANNQIVVIQGDRAMPGQKAQSVPVLGGHLSLPLGPIRLAQISGSSIIPVFTIRTASGRCRLFVEPAIRVDPDAELINGVHPQMLQWGKVIEKFVAAYPAQWLILEPAFIEDAASRST